MADVPLTEGEGALTYAAPPTHPGPFIVRSRSLFFDGAGWHPGRLARRPTSPHGRSWRTARYWGTSSRRGRKRGLLDFLTIEDGGSSLQSESARRPGPEYGTKVRAGSTPC